MSVTYQQEPGLAPEEFIDVLLDPEVEARDQRIETGVGAHLRRIEDQFLAPDQSGCLTHIDDPFEEPVEDLHTQAIPDAAQAGMLGQRLIQVIAQIPAVRQIQASHLDQSPFRADPLEEHDELELEEDDRIDGRPTDGLIAAVGELAHEAEIQLSLQLPVKVITRDHGLQRDQDRTIETTLLQRTKHQPARPRQITRRVDRNERCYRLGQG